MFKILNRNREVVGLITSPINPIIEDNLTGMNELKFSVPATQEGLELEGYIRIENEHEYVIKEISTHGHNREVIAIMNVEELIGKVWTTFRSIDMYPTDCIREIVAGTGWTVVDDCPPNKKRNLYGTQISSWDLIFLACDVWGIEVKFDTHNKTITTQEKGGTDRGTYFMSDLNLKQLMHDSHTHKLITRVIPIGKDGLTIEEVNGGKNYISNHSYSNKVITGIWQSDRYTKAQDLMDDAREYLAEMCVPYESYECKVSDLYRLEKNPNFEFNVGDVIYLIDNITKKKIQQRIIKHTKNLTSPDKDTINLANKSMSFTDYYKRLQLIANMTEQAIGSDGLISNGSIESVDADKITGDIKATLIDADTIISEHIKADQILAGHIKADQIYGEHIVSDEIDTRHLKADSIQANHIQTGTIQSNHIQTGTIQSNHIQTGAIQSGHIQAGAITAGSSIIGEGAIGSAQISSLDANKINAGEIDTSKVKIKGENGFLFIENNTLYVVDNNRKIRCELGVIENNSNYGFVVRGADGQTIMLDHRGVHNAGITDGAIDNRKVSENANISGKKLDIDSVVKSINEDGSVTLQGTKVQIGNTTLDVKLSEQNNLITEQGQKLATQQSEITANTNAIKLKVDNQTYTEDKKNMTSSLNKATSDISVLQGQVALKVEQTDITNAVNTLSGAVDKKITDAKAEIKATTDNISQKVSSTETTVSNLTTRVSNAESKLTKDSLTTTIGSHYTTSTDVDNAITSKGYATTSQVQQTADSLSAKFSSSGGYNLIRNSTGAYSSTSGWTHTATSMGVGANDNIGSNHRDFLYIDNGTTTSEKSAFSSRFKLKPNTKYRLTGYFYNYTTCPSFDVYVLSSTSVSDVDTGTSFTNAHHLIANQNTNATWKKYTATFTTPASTKSGIVRIDNNGYNSSGSGSNRIHWNCLILTEGELEVPWSPHPSEVYDGVTMIDKTGVKVSQSNYKGYTQMKADGFYVNNGTENVISCNTNGLSVKGKITATSGSISGSTTIDGNGITTGTINGTAIKGNSITSDHIQAGAITASKLDTGVLKVGNISQADSQSKAYINLFDSMSIDGSGGALRFQYDASNYLYVGRDFIDFYNSSGGESPFMHFYGGSYTQHISTQSNALTINSSGLHVSNGGFNCNGTVNTAYLKATGNINVPTVYSTTIQNSGTTYTKALAGYNGGSILMHSALDGNGKNLGYSGSKFYQVSAQYVWGDSGSVSDIRTKENVTYLDVESLNEDGNTSKKVTKTELFDFINNLKLCEYNYKKEFSPNDKLNKKIGFIADDVVGDKVGDKIVAEHEGYLTYNVNNLLFTTIGALQEEIQKRESLEKRLQELEDKVSLLLQTT